MGKIIIHNRIGDDNLALDLVSRVVYGGKVSETSYGKQYCFITVFHTNLRKVQVDCVMHKSGTTTFWVSEDERGESDD